MHSCTRQQRTSNSADSIGETMHDAVHDAVHDVVHDAVHDASGVAGLTTALARPGLREGPAQRAGAAAARQ